MVDDTPRPGNAAAASVQSSMVATDPFGSPSHSNPSLNAASQEIGDQSNNRTLPSEMSIQVSSQASSSSLGGPSVPPTPSMNHARQTDFMNRTEAYGIVSAQIYRQAQRARLFSELEDVWNGVALRFARQQYIYFPNTDPRLDPWIEALNELNPQATMSVTSTVVTGVAVALPNDARVLVLPGGDRLQVIDTVPQLAMARKAQGACFVRCEGRLLVWTDTVEQLIPRAQALEAELLRYMWVMASNVSRMLELDNSQESLDEKDGETTDSIAEPEPAMVRKRGFGGLFSKKGKHEPSKTVIKRPKKGDFVEEDEEDDQVEEGGEPRLQKGRKMMVLAPIYTGLSVSINILIVSLFVRTLLLESLLDGQYLRMALAVALPLMMIVTQFLCENIVHIIAQLIMPITQMKRNSLYYSGKASPRSCLKNGQLPHFTIQMPVYKEGLDTVLIPTIESVKEAIATYELQGGSANMMICEDGMQLLDDKDREIRRDYYDRNNLGWVARPKHGKDGYVRKGRFKKASNLNFACDLSLRIEAIMDERRAEAQRANGQDASTWFQEDESALYDQCLQIAIDETEGRAWAAGDIRIGDYILLIDSDTRVPKDCFLDAACEMEACPEVGALQHCSGVMYVANHYFESMIGFFTTVVNFSISWCVANGAVAPLMGHNAFLRWSALQEVIHFDDDGERCVWSTKHVSEDFDMALRLLMKGYIVRWATYSNSEFLEGVSLTPDDEINRWQKYAFGCSELVFNPLRYWFTRGPLTPLFRKFIWSKQCPTSYKVNACSYIFSYTALAISPPLTIGLFAAQGFFYPQLDPVVLTPFNVWVTVVLVFIAGGTTGLVVARSRAGRTTLLRAMVDHISWIPAFLVFFGGLSYHVMLALFAHPFGYNMTWSATIKDFDENGSNFWREIPAIFRRYWHCYAIMFTFAIGMVLVSTPLVPMEWRVEGFTVFWTGAFVVATHVLFPIVLNPWLMRFEF